MLTVSKLNKEIFTKDIKCVSLGKLSSFIELKTVQILDRLELEKPCIDAEDECFNTEWSTEFTLDDQERKRGKRLQFLPLYDRSDRRTMCL